MGAYLSQPNTVKTSANGGNHGISYGFSAMQGWRISMEVRTFCQCIDLKVALWPCFPCQRKNVAGNIMCS